MKTEGPPSCLPSAAFPVKVAFEVGRVQRDRRAALRYLYLSGPQDGVDHQPAEILVAPVAVPVPPGKPERAPAVVALEGPGEDFGAPLVRAGRRRAAHAVGRGRLENGRDLL